MRLAVLALIGSISAEELTIGERLREIQMKKAKFPFATPQDEVANGDRDEDKELEDEDDPNDVIADDNGFVNQFKGKGGNFVGTNADMRIRHRARFPFEKPSDEVANGDRDEDRQVEDEDDPNDDIVDDNGFVNQYKGRGNLIGTNSDVRLNKKQKAKFPFATP